MDNSVFMFFVNKAEFMLFTGQVVLLAMSQEGTEDSTASRNGTPACSECNSDTAGTSYSSLRAKHYSEFQHSKSKFLVSLFWRCLEMLS